jgi:hypothetical protein
VADIKVSALPAVSSALLTHELPVNETGTSKKVTLDQVLVLDAARSSVFGVSTTTQAITANTDTYITGSRCVIPATTGRGSIKAGTMYRVRMHASKTAAGAQAPVFTVRFGTAGSTADTSIGVITFASQTAAVDEGRVEINCTWLTIGSGTSATMRAWGALSHRLAATGFSTSNESCILAATGAGHNSTLASAGVGVSVNTGTSAAWTLAMVQVELINLA